VSGTWTETKSLPGEQPAQVDGCCSGFLDGVRGHVGVAGLDRHPEPQGALGQTPPDGAEADDAQSLALHLDSHEPPRRAAVPSHEGRMGRDHIASQAQHQGHGVVGDRGGLGPGRVDDLDSAAGGCSQVHLVHGDADPADDLEAPAPLQNVSR